MGSLSQVDLLIITGLQAGSPEQTASAKSTSLCPLSVLFCLSALIKAQECCLFMFLQRADSSSEANSSDIQLEESIPLVFVVDHLNRLW